MDRREMLAVELDEQLEAQRWSKRATDSFERVCYPLPTCNLLPLITELMVFKIDPTRCLAIVALNSLYSHLDSQSRHCCL